MKISSKFYITSPVTIKLLALTSAAFFPSTEVWGNAESLWAQELYYYLFAFIGIWASMMIAIFAIDLIPKTTLRLTWLAIFSISTILAEISLHMTEYHINDDTVQLVWNARHSVDAFFQGHWLLIVITTVKASLLPLISLCLPRLYTKTYRGAALLPLIPLALLVATFYHTDGLGTRGLPPQLSSIAVIGGWAVTPETTFIKDEVQLPLTSPPLIKHIVLIVDESIRADYLDINSSRNVTPYLLNNSMNIFNFGFASSGSNCTATSNAFLRMGINPRTSSTSPSDLRTHPTLWKYAKRAGFKTYFIDNQRTSGQLQNYMDEAELSLIDSVHQFPKGFQRKLRDHASIDHIKSILKNPTPSFIYINKAGAHTHYETAYPSDHAVYSPHLEGLEPPLNRDKMINSYKNAVHWSVDLFFKKFLPELNLKDTLIIYTSDHGQNLLDDGLPATHCRTDNPRQEEAIVPLFAITENQELKRDFQNAAYINRNRATHFQIFPTILILFGFSPGHVEERYYPPLFTQMVDSPRFTSAEVLKRFGQKAQWGTIKWHSVKLADPPHTIKQE